jgi:hypothetical protein
MSTSDGQTQAAFELRTFIDSVLTIAWSALPATWTSSTNDFEITPGFLRIS